MTNPYKTCPILMAEDDEDDRFLVQKAMEKNQVPNPLVIVPDGEELLDYLHRRGRFSGLAAATAPCLILLDLNMPRMDGRQALKFIKSDEKLKKIPIVVLTTSPSPEDLDGSYDVGANSYIRKPSSFDGLVKAVLSLKQYWLETVQLPPEKGSESHA